MTTVLSNLVLCASAGYAFARFRFLGRGALFVLIMITLMVPFQVTMIPQFLITKWIGVNLLAGRGDRSHRIADRAERRDRVRRLLPAPVLPDAADRVRGGSQGRRRDQADRAAAGSCCRSRLPALATLAALTFLDSWNSFLWPLIAITSTNASTLPLGLATFQGAHATEWTLLMAGNVMSLAPMLLVFLLAQRYFVRSVAATGLTGT